MRISCVGWFLIAMLMVINLLVVAIGYHGFKQVTELETQWQQHSIHIERESVIIRQVLTPQAALTEKPQSVTLAQMGSLPSKWTAERDSDVERSQIMLSLLNQMSQSRGQQLNIMSENVAGFGRSLLFFLVLATIFVGALALYVGWFFNYQMIMPLRQLMHAFAGIRIGHTTQEHLPLSAQHHCHELSELAKAGNKFLDVAQHQLRLQMRAQQQALANEQRISAILDSTAEGIVTLDSGGVVLSYNLACQQIFGFQYNEVIGRDIVQLLCQKDRTQQLQYVLNANANASEQYVISNIRELYGRRKNGEVFPMELSVSHVELAGERCYIVVTHDISARKANETSLINAKREAEKANLAKSQFLSAMSHELRTPLNAILGFGQLMQISSKEPLSKTQSINIEQILQAGEHLLLLINDILDLTKIESGKFEIEFEQVNLHAMVEQCVEFLDCQSKKADVRVQIDTSVTPSLLLYSSVVRLKQVLLNLLSNAIKYNRPGGNVVIRCEQNQHDKVRIEVVDSGVGISKSNYAGVFEPFVRFDEHAEEIEGTGIGLSVCCSLVEAMKGDIGFSSQVGVGSTFYVTLPLYQSPVEQCLVKKPVAQIAHKSLGFDGKLLLYIEDNLANIKLMKVLIADISDLTFISAINGEMGMKIAELKSPDIIFMDINLPGMNGFEAFQALKDNPKTCHIPVIALSVSASKDTINKGLNMGFSDYLTKPLVLLQVRDAITSALCPVVN